MTRFVDVYKVLAGDTYPIPFPDSLHMNRAIGKEEPRHIMQRERSGQVATVTVLRMESIEGVGSMTGIPHGCFAEWRRVHRRTSSNQELWKQARELITMVPKFLQWI
jgi:hypothetical protein